MAFASYMLRRSGVKVWLVEQSQNKVSCILQYVAVFPWPYLHVDSVACLLILFSHILSPCIIAFLNGWLSDYWEEVIFVLMPARISSKLVVRGRGKRTLLNRHSPPLLPSPNRRENARPLSILGLGLCEQMALFRNQTGELSFLECKFEESDSPGLCIL
jgi:hypothetical protein